MVWPARRLCVSQSDHKQKPLYCEKCEVMKITLIIEECFCALTSPDFHTPWASIDFREVNRVTSDFALRL
jgi:hypothetical protein